MSSYFKKIHFTMLGGALLLGYVAFRFWPADENRLGESIEVLKATPQVEQASDDPQELTKFDVVLPKTGTTEKQVELLTLQMIQFSLERKRLLELAHLSDGQKYRAQSKQIKEELRELEKEIQSRLKSSEQTRAQFFATIEKEKDPLLKSQLMKVTRSLPPELKKDFVMGLSNSQDPQNRKIGLATLPSLGTQEALTQLKEHATHDTDQGVQVIATKGLATVARDQVGQLSSVTASQTLRELSHPNNSLEIRETAFRALIAKPFLSQDDIDYVNNFAQTEPDSKLREIGLSAKKALTLRK